MLIKKLTKAETEEGLTLEMVNNFNPESHYSPVQMQIGDEPVEILKCSKGYWIKDIDPGTFIKNPDGSLMVYNERDCQIGRARYMVNYGETEKQSKIDTLVAKWRIDATLAIDKVKNQIEDIEKEMNTDSFSIARVLKSAAGITEAMQKEGNELAIAKLTQIKIEAERLYREDKIVEILEMFGIKKFANPMMSIKTEDKKGISMMKKIFGADALQKWDGNVLNRYAAIEVEREYA